MVLPERQTNSDGSLQLPSEVDSTPAPLFVDIPEATVEDGKVKFSDVFNFDSWKSRLSDTERVALKTAGPDALAARINDDRAQWQKVQQLATTSGEDGGAFYRGILEDPAAWSFVKRRGLDEKLFPSADLGDVAKEALFGVGRGALALVADLGEGDRFVAGTKAEAGIESTKVGYKTLGLGAWNNLMRLGSATVAKFEDIIGNEDEAYRVSQEYHEIDRNIRLKQLETATKFDAYLENRSSLLGISKEQLNDSATGMSLVIDPANLLDVGAGVVASKIGSVGAKMSTATAHAALSELPGLVSGLGQELVERTAERTALAGRAAASKLAPSKVLQPVLDEVSRLDQVIADLQTKFDVATNLVNTATDVSLASGPSVARRAAGTAVGAAGSVAESVGRGVTQGLEWAGEKVPAVAKPAALAAGGFIAGSVLGGDSKSGLAGALIGGIPGAAKVLTQLGRDAGIVGGIVKAGATGPSAMAGTIARSEASKMTRAVAGLVDRASILDRPVRGISLVNTAGRALKGAAGGAAVGGAIGAIGGGEEGAVAGAVSSAPFGFVGGAANALNPIENLEVAARYLEAQRNIVESRFKPSAEGAETPNWAAWQKLSRGQQLSTASILHAYPDIDLKVANAGPDGPAGMWSRDRDGRGTIVVNADSTTPLRGILSHELSHDMQARGLTKSIERLYLGDPLENRPGLFTKRDAAGEPVLDTTVNKDGSPRYAVNDDFLRHRARYEQLMVKSGQDVGSLTHSDIAMELAAEEGAQFMLDGGFERALNPSLAGVLSDTVSNWQWSRNLLAKMGVPVDGERPLTGSKLFDEVKSSPEVQALIRKHMDNLARTGRQADYSAADPGTQISRQEIRDNPDILDTFLASGDLAVDPKTGLPAGVSRDPKTGKLKIDDESKVFHSPSQANRLQKELVKEIQSQLARVANKDPDVVQARVTDGGDTVYAGRYLPDEVLDAIEAQNKFNPHQLRQLREMNRALKDTAGQGFTFFYQPAERRLIGGRRDKSVRALEGHWRTEIPYAISISGQNNILVKTFSPDTFIENVDRGWSRGKGRELWTKREDLVTDAMKYLDNLSHNKPGEEGLGNAKKNWLNAAFGWRGKDRANVNPLYATLASDTRTPVIARRLDRINKSTPTTSERTTPWTWRANERAKQNLRPADVDVADPRAQAEQAIETFLKVQKGDGVWPRNGIKITESEANKLQAALEKEVFAWPDSVLKEKVESLERTGVGADEWLGSLTRYRPADESARSGQEDAQGRDEQRSFRVDAATRGPDFESALRVAAASQPAGAAVDIKAPEFYTDPGTKLFLDPSGEAGVAVTDYADLVSVFKKRGSQADIRPVLAEAAQHSRTLDAYAGGNGYLPNLYAQYDFKPVARVKFNREYAKPNWNYELMGEPDVVLMVRDPKGVLEVPTGKWNDIQDKVPLFENYDDAAKAQQDAVAKVKESGYEIRFRPADGPEAFRSTAQPDQVADSEYWISQRVPTAKKSTEGATTHDLTIGAAEVMPDYESKKAVAQVIGKYPNIKGASTTPNGIVNEFMGHTVGNLLWLHDNFAPKLRDRAKLWYDGARKIATQFSKEYGIERQQAAGVLAALSPQKDWFMNVELARRLIDANTKLKDATFDQPMQDWFNKKFASVATPKTEALKAIIADAAGKKYADLSPVQRAVMIRAHDEISNPRAFPVVTPEGGFGDTVKNKDGTTESKLAWGDFGSIAKGVQILQDGSRESISARLGMQHKVRNFFNNILLPEYADKGDVTIDTHAVAAALLTPLAGSDVPVLHNFGGEGAPGSAITGASGTYGLYADAYRQAAAQRDLLPREMQSITWEAVRGLFTDTFKTPANRAKVENAWKEYREGKITIDAARQRILEIAGGINVPSWAVGSNP
jgi:hypothetical protein